MKRFSNNSSVLTRSIRKLDISGVLCWQVPAYFLYGHLRLRWYRIRHCLIFGQAFQLRK